jgi:transposase
MKRNKISAQRKLECIQYALNHPEIGVRQLALDFGVGHSTLHKWLQDAKESASELRAPRQLTAEQQRIKQLEKEVAHLREVNEIIKKAHVYFINHPNR